MSTKHTGGKSWYTFTGKEAQIQKSPSMSVQIGLAKISPDFVGQLSASSCFKMAAN